MYDENSNCRNFRIGTAAPLWSNKLENRLSLVSMCKSSHVTTLVFNLKTKTEVNMPEKFRYRSSALAVLQQVEGYLKIHNSRYKNAVMLKFYERTNHKIFNDSGIQPIVQVWSQTGLIYWTHSLFNFFFQLTTLHFFQSLGLYLTSGLTCSTSYTKEYSLYVSLSIHEPK